MIYIVGSLENANGKAMGWGPPLNYCWFIQPLNFVDNGKVMVNGRYNYSQWV